MWSLTVMLGPPNRWFEGAVGHPWLALRSGHEGAAARHIGEYNLVFGVRPLTLG
jgi:hypothetical protein